MVHLGIYKSRPSARGQRNHRLGQKREKDPGYDGSGYDKDVRGYRVVLIYDGQVGRGNSSRKNEIYRYDG